MRYFIKGTKYSRPNILVYSRKVSFDGIPTLITNKFDFIHSHPNSGYGRHIYIMEENLKKYIENQGWIKLGN